MKVFVNIELKGVKSAKITMHEAISLGSYFDSSQRSKVKFGEDYFHEYNHKLMDIVASYYTFNNLTNYKD